MTSKIVSEYDQEIAHSQTAAVPHDAPHKQSRETMKTNKAKQPPLSSKSSFFSKLEWTHSNAQQNIGQLQNPTMDVTITGINNNRTAALEQTAAEASRGGGWGFNAF